MISSSQRPLPDNTHHSQQISMPPVGFEPTISAGERPQTYALDRTATGTGYIYIYIYTHTHTYITNSIEQSPSWEANGSPGIPRNSLRLTEPEGSLPHSQEPATCQYPEPHQSSPYFPATSWRVILILSSYLRLGLPSSPFSSSFPTKTLYARLISPLRATCIANLILCECIQYAIERH